MCTMLSSTVHHADCVPGLCLQQDPNSLEVDMFELMDDEQKAAMGRPTSQQTASAPGTVLVCPYDMMLNARYVTFSIQCKRECSFRRVQYITVQSDRSAYCVARQDLLIF